MEGNMVLRMKKVRPGAQLPQRQTAGSAGFDLCACIQEPVVLEPGDSALFPTGLAAEIPRAMWGSSSPAAAWGQAWGCRLQRGGRHRQRLPRGAARGAAQPQPGGLRHPAGERVAQLVILPVCLPELAEVEELSETARGQGGFGSTGR